MLRNGLPTQEGIVLFINDVPDIGSVVRVRIDCSDYITTCAWERGDFLYLRGSPTPIPLAEVACPPVWVSQKELLTAPSWISPTRPPTKPSSSVTLPVKYELLTVPSLSFSGRVYWKRIRQNPQSSVIHVVSQHECLTSCSTIKYIPGISEELDNYGQQDEGPDRYSLSNSVALNGNRKDCKNQKDAAYIY